jgi:hypothetical protein
VRCSKVTTSAINYGSQAGTIDQKTVELSPVNDDANKTWSKYTPSGAIQLTINNPEAFEAFKPGETYFVDFSQAPAKESDEK